MKYLKSINEELDSKNISIIRTDDWEGVYYQDKLLDEGHGIDWHHVLKALGYSVDYKYIDQEKFEDCFGSNCPDTLDEVKMKLDAKKYNI